MTNERKEKIVELALAINVNPGNSDKVSDEQVASYVEQKTDSEIDTMILETKFNDVGKVKAKDVLEAA